MGIGTHPRSSPAKGAGKHMHCGQLVALWGLALVTGILAPAPLPADVHAVKGLTVKAARGARGVPQFALGQPVEVCFDILREGFVSLWERDADGGLERIVPNEFMADGADSVHVGTRGSRTYCVGGRDDWLVTDDGAEEVRPGTYRFFAKEPLGRFELLLFWTSWPEEQPDTDAIAERTKATLVFQYEIVGGVRAGQPAVVQEQGGSSAAAGAGVAESVGNGVRVDSGEELRDGIAGRRDGPGR